MKASNPTGKYYRQLSLGAAIIFGVVGLIFVLMPRQVLVFFNMLSYFGGFPLAPEDGFSFYTVLTGAYMYLVTVLACLMYRNPEEPVYPFLLAHGKFMSSLLSLAAFIFSARYLIYLANFFVDGIIGVIAYYLYSKVKRLKP